MSEHYDVVIATPGETFDQHYVWSIVYTTEHLTRSGISWIWLNDYSSNVNEVRQRLVGQTLELSYNKLFWIDSDIYWTIDDFMKLYLSPHEIVSGCYITTSGKVSATGFDDKLLKPEELKNRNDLIEIESAGLGFMCLQHGVIESLYNAFSSVGEILNEDIAFCLRAKNELNLPIWLDTSVKLEDLEFRKVKKMK